MLQIVLVFVGGGLGSVARHGVNVTAGRFGADFPWGTFTVNVVGSLVMGLIAGWLAFRAGESWSQHARLVLITGFLGGFTTFSAFSLDTAALWERGASATAAIYVVASVALSLAAVFAGLWVVRSLS
jgi:fluoride exporter